MPVSFSLNNNYHRNALSIIESVIFDALKNISSIIITPIIQITIDSLKEIIDLCLNVDNSLTFEQELPIIMNTPKAMETPSKSFSQPITPHPKKRSAYPLDSYSPSKQSRKGKDQFKETLEKAFEF